MMRRSPLPVLLFGALLAIGITAALGYRAAVNLALPYPEARGTLLNEERLARPDTVFVGVISRFPSNVIYQGYQPVMDYLTETTDYHFVLRPSEGYEEAVRHLVEGEVSAAFLGSFLYVRAHEEYGVRPLLQPLNAEGEGSFRSVLIARESGGAQTAGDLSGLRLALPSELSFSANWLRLDSAMEPFALVQHFPYHQTVVFEVLQGNFDVGVVKDRVAQEYRHRGIRILATSDPVPGSPLVVPARSDPALERAIVTALLALEAENPAHAERLRSWDPEFAFGFTVARDADYDGLRALLRRGPR
jgi:phosphonate transport system substrate-binding protein